MVQQLHLVWYLVKRDFQVRYSGSVLGFLWSLAIPLSQLLIISFVFTKVIPIGIENLPVFVLTGLVPWNWFASSVASAAPMFTESRDLLRHPGLNPAVLVLVMMLVHLMTLLLSVPVLVGMLYWYGIGLTWLSPLALLLLILIQGVMIAGLSLLVATANVFYRDVAHLVSLLVFLLFFVTPVWYAPPADGSYSVIFDLNPMSQIVQNYRLLLIEQQGLDWFGLFLASVVSLFFLAVGYWVYRRAETDMLDAI